MVFTQRNFVAYFLQVKRNFRRKTAVLRFLSPFGGLRGTYDVHIGLIGKRGGMDLRWREKATPYNSQPSRLQSRRHVYKTRVTSTNQP